MRERVGDAVSLIGVGFLYAPMFRYSVGTVYGVALPHPWTLFAGGLCIAGGALLMLPKGYWRDDD